MNNLKTILMETHDLTEEEAQEEILRAKGELMDRIETRQNPWELCDEFWGLEPDYLEELMFI